MNILFCPDSFKGCLNSVSLNPNLENIDFCPMSDGGEGFLEVIQLVLPITINHYQGIPYGVLDSCVYLEASKIIGYQREPTSSLLSRDSRLLGDVIEYVVSQGAESLVIACGGTGVHDGGVGLLQSLGARFTNKHGELVAWNNFEEVSYFERPKNFKTSITVLCDVESSFIDSLKYYAPNKTTDLEELKILKKRFETLIKFYGSDGPRCGIGGGISHALRSQCHAQLEMGFEHVSKIFDLESKIKQADLVVTGEGRLDSSTLQGKLVDRIGKLCHRYQKPCVVICGSWDGKSQPEGVTEIISLEDRYGKNIDSQVTRERIYKTINSLASSLSIDNI